MPRKTTVLNLCPTISEITLPNVRHKTELIVIRTTDKIKVMTIKPATLPIKISRRFLPTLIGLYVIGSLLQSQPKLAYQFTSKILERFGFNIASTNLQKTLDLIEKVNSFRAKNSKPLLERSSTLDSLAHVIALSSAQNSNYEPKIDLKQAAQIVSYHYDTISYFAVAIPKDTPFLTSQNWLSDNSKELLSTEFTQIGSAVVAVNNDNLHVIVIASPQKISTKKPTTKGATTDSPTYNASSPLWTQVQEYRTQHGVAQFTQDNTLCEMATIRLNQLIQLGRLDHEGFQPLVNQFRESNSLKYNHVGENLLSGYNTPTEQLAAWDGSPTHQALLRDGAYTFACIATSHGFAVLIVAF